MGFLASADLAAATDTLLFTMATAMTVNVRFANRNATNVKIRLAITSGGAPASKDYLSFDIMLLANGIVEDTGIAVSAGEKIYVRTDTTLVSVRLHGI